MKRLFLTLFAALLVCSAFAQSRTELYDSFKDATSRHDTAAIASLISDWEKLFPNDAELYSVKANYYFQGAVNEVVVLSDEEPADGRECLAAQDSLGVKGYMYSEVQIDSSKLDSAKMILAEGIIEHPDRLDLRLGKVTIHLYVNETVLAVQEIQSALEHSVKNHNNWFGALDKPIETDGVSYLRGCIQDYLSQLLNANDLASAERMIDVCIKLYPDDAVFLTDKGSVRFYAGDPQDALKWFLEARKNSPDDMLIATNIASLYEQQGDVEEALKYYDIVAVSDDEEFAEIAKAAIQELNEPVKNREIIHVDWKELKAIVKDNPDMVRGLVARLCAPESDVTLTYEERITAFYGQSLLSEGAEKSLVSAVSQLFSQKDYADALVKAKEALVINPLNLRALDKAGMCIVRLIESGDASYTKDDAKRYFNIAMRIYNTIAMTGLGNEAYPFCVTSVADEYEFMRNYLEIYEIEEQVLIGVCDVFTLAETSKYYSDTKIYFDATRPLELLSEAFLK